MSSQTSLHAAASRPRPSASEGNFGRYRSYIFGSCFRGCLAAYMTLLNIAVTDARCGMYQTVFALVCATGRLVNGAVLARMNIPILEGSAWPGQYFAPLIERCCDLYPVKLILCGSFADIMPSLLEKKDLLYGCADKEDCPEVQGFL